MLRQLKMKVAWCREAAEQVSLGGTCLNVGCIPRQGPASIRRRCARQPSHKLARHGIRVGSVALDLAVMLARKDKVVGELTGGVGYLFKKYGVTPNYGTGKLPGPGNRVEVSRRARQQGPTIIETKNILLATGSESTELPFLKFDGKFVVSSTEALTFQTVPKHLIVVGGGYIGLELGSVWKRLGAKVTVVEFLPRILTICDGEISSEVQKLLAKQGDGIPPRNQGDGSDDLKAASRSP